MEDFEDLQAALDQLQELAAAQRADIEALKEQREAPLGTLRYAQPPPA